MYNSIYFTFPEFVTVDGVSHKTYSIVSPVAGVAHAVTCSRAEAEAIANRFTQNNLSPIHFWDAIEDSIV